MNTLSHASLAVVLALSLGACADRSPDDGDTATGPGPSPAAETPDTAVGDEDAGPSFATDLPDPVEPGDADAEPSLDPIFDNGTPTPDPIDDDAGPGLDPIFDNGTPTPDPIDDDAGPGLDPIFDNGTPTPDPIGDADPGLDPIFDTGTPPIDPVDDTAENPSVDPADDVVAAPAFPGRPDAARLHATLTRIVGATLLDLNARLSGGVELTGQQLDCLGDHDAALGEPLLGIDCERALATEPVAVYVERGAFAPTDTCRASVAEGTIDECILSVVDARVAIDYVQISPARRPSPVAGSGVIVDYAAGRGVLEISREPSAPVEDFRCGIDVATGATLVTDRGDCDAAFRDTARYVESLLAPT